MYKKINFLNELFVFQFGKLYLNLNCVLFYLYHCCQVSKSEFEVESFEQNLIRSHCDQHKAYELESEEFVY